MQIYRAQLVCLVCKDINNKSSQQPFDRTELLNEPCTCGAENWTIKHEEVVEHD